MNISFNQNRNSGVVWLIIFIFIPVALLAAWLLWKIFHWNPQYDITHGNGDPESNMVAQVIAQYGANAVIFIPELQLTLPIEALAYEWRYETQTSTNLADWTEIMMEWEEVLESIQTNHGEPMRFYRRQLFW